MVNPHSKPETQNDGLESFALLVDEHQAAIRAFVTSRINDPFEAHDLAQEVFLVAFKKLGQIDAERPLRPWLLGIASHQIRNHHRKRKAIPIGSHEEINQLLSAEIQSSGSAWQDGTVFEALDRCLAKLDSHGRELLRLRHDEGMDLAEIRASHGGKHSALTMKLHRLREQLRNCIESQLNQGASHG